MTYELQNKNIELTQMLRFHVKQGYSVRQPRHQISQLQIFLHKHLEHYFLGILRFFSNFSSHSRALTRHPKEPYASARETSACDARASSSPASSSSAGDRNLSPTRPKWSPFLVDPNATGLRPKHHRKVLQTSGRSLGQTVRPIFRWLLKMPSNSHENPPFYPETILTHQGAKAL